MSKKIQAPPKLLNRKELLAILMKNIAKNFKFSTSDMINKTKNRLDAFDYAYKLLDALKKQGATNDAFLGGPTNEAALIGDAIRKLVESEYACGKHCSCGGKCDGDGCGNCGNGSAGNSSSGGKSGGCGSGGCGGCGGHGKP